MSKNFNVFSFTHGIHIAQPAKGRRGRHSLSCERSTRVNLRAPESATDVRHYRALLKKRGRVVQAVGGGGRACRRGHADSDRAWGGRKEGATGRPGEQWDDIVFSNNLPGNARLWGPLTQL